MSCSWSNRLPGLEESGNFFTGSPFGGSCACWVSKALVKSCSKESHFTSFYSVSLQEPVLPPCRARLLTNTPEVAGPRTSGVLSSKGIPRPLQQTVSHLFSASLRGCSLRILCAPAFGEVQITACLTTRVAREPGGWDSRGMDLGHSR